jgi:chaperone required for assembly of F1-ATPase
MKRFYRAVAVAPVEGGWQVQLDGRGVKSVGGAPQVVPSEALALVMAAEWDAQGERLDPASFMLRDLADYALDVVAPDHETAMATLLRFAETDTLCYRAEPDEALAERQDAVWEPLLTAAEARWDIHFKRVAGIIHRPQPTATLARLQTVLGTLDTFQLAALTTLASLAASLVVGLAALDPEPDAAALWDAANLEEDWQAEMWGSDYEAVALRARKLATFTSAQLFARLAR